MMTESQLIKKMDAMKPEIRVCPKCPTSINMDEWKMLTGDEKWAVRREVAFQVKRRSNEDGVVRYSLETMCKECRNAASRKRVRKKVKEVVPCDSAMNKFLYGVRLCRTS